MSAPKALACAAVLASALPLLSQTAPTAYTITQLSTMGTTPITATVYRSGSKAVIETEYPTKAGPVQHARTLYDLTAGTSFSWDPSASTITCSTGTFSGDWGDPFGMSAELPPKIASGEFKPSGTEAIAGISTKVYASTSPQGSIKVWFDEKDNLVVRAQMISPQGATQTMVDIKKVSLGAPAASVFALPAPCAGTKAPPTPAELIATATGDNPDNYVNAIYGPGSANACNVVLRVVHAQTMAPFTGRLQIAIDTTYNVDSPPHYTFGMHDDGTQTFAGGGLHEITSQVHNGTVRIDHPPAYFNLSTNIVKPGGGTGMGLIYRQCFAPTTVLLYVVKDFDNPALGGDYLWAKSGKYATPPAN